MAEQSLSDKQTAIFQRARKGVVKFVVDHGGSVEMGEMHNFSEKTFFIGHQGFSRLMETLVDERLVDFDRSTGMATVTDAGKIFAATV